MDVGRSTSAHEGTSGAIRSERATVELENWGAWMRDQPPVGPGSSPAPSPIWRDMLAGYRETFATELYDEARAERCDRLIATVCQPDHARALVARYVARLSSREAGGRISGWIGAPVSRATYRQWLEIAESCVAAAYALE